MPLSLLNHSALALFAQRTRIPTSARRIGFCAIWLCISSSSSSGLEATLRVIEEGTANRLQGLTYGGEGNPNHQCTQQPMRRGVCL